MSRVYLAELDDACAWVSAGKMGDQAQFIAMQASRVGALTPGASAAQTTSRSNPQNNLRQLPVLARTWRMDSPIPATCTRSD